MKNTFGNNLAVTVFGESHGEAIGCIIDGLPAGIRPDMQLMRRMLNQRRASGDISTARKEADIPEILSGISRGYTQGTPVAIVIRNENVRRSDYENINLKPRPSHADYSAFMKYGGYHDLSGGGHFSGRLTAPVTAAGAICMSMLNQKGIEIGTHICSLYGIEDRAFDEEDLSADIGILKERVFPVLDDDAGQKMQEAIRQAASESDSLGGILDTAVTGLPAGIGEPWFDSLESVISHAVFSVGGVKGIEFGAGFRLAEMKGSEANDAFMVQDGKVITLTNHSGGINGGISNGMPVRFRTAIRPTPSIAKKQKTVSLSSMQNTEIEIHGRHDPAIIHRVRAVIDAVTAIALCDLLISRCGTDWFREDSR